MNQLEEILQKAMFADEEAFEQLCYQLLPLIRGVYYKHFFYELELEDFIQEADCLLIRVIQKCNSLKVENFIAYYQKTLNNFSIQVIRHEHRKRLIPYSLRVSDSLCEILCEAPTLVSGDKLMEIREETSEYLYQLSKLERKVLIAVLNDEPLVNVAKSCQKEVDTIQRAYQRSRQKYRKILKGSTVING